MLPDEAVELGFLWHGRFAQLQQRAASAACYMIITKQYNYNYGVLLHRTPGMSAFPQHQLPESPRLTLSVIGACKLCCSPHTTVVMLVRAAECNEGS